MKSNKKIINSLFTLIIVMIGMSGYSQNSGIETESRVHDYGSIENIYTLESEFVIKNANPKKLYVMRADAVKGIKIHINKKAIETGDTTLLTVIYQPTGTGRFSENIKLVTSADAEPLILNIKGNIKSIKTDDKTACYYFGKPKRNFKSNEIMVIPSGKEVIKETEKNTEPEPERKDDEVISKHEPLVLSTVKDVVETDNYGNVVLNRDEYKPNNITFLVDVSGSMRDSMKLPLMKESLYTLLKSLRDIDKVTFITYADSIKLICEAVPGTEKKRLENIVKGLKTKGYTRGAKAILYSLDVALQHYIPEGNNQIFLATDGKFVFYDGHYKQWTEKQGDKQIILSTVCFGNDKEAISNLKEISEKGKGSFIRIKTYKNTEGILDEVKLRSKK